MRTLLTVVAVVVVACAGSAPAAGPPTVGLGEFSVEASGGWVSGRNEVVVRNAGEFAHTLVVADEWGTVVAASEVVAPGEETVFPVDLHPGRYELSCRIVVQTGEGDLVDHYAEGMLTTVEVTLPD